MQTKQLSTSPGGAGAANGVITITTPAGGPAPGIFRAVRYLRLNIGAGAEEIVVDPSKCRLDASFLTYSYNALPASAANLRASVTDNGVGLVIALDAPRRIREISVSPFLTVGGPYTLELYRMDGNVPAEEPSFTASPRPAPSVQAGPQKKASGGSPRGSGSSGGGVMALMADSSGIGSVGTGTTVYAEVETFVTILTGDNVFNVDFTDQRFLMKVRGAGGVHANLAVSNLNGLTVESYPRSARVGIAFPAPGAAADPAAANFFWRVAGDIGNGVPVSAGVLHEGATLGAELARAATRYAEALRDQAPEGPPPTLPATLDVALVVESDAPCRFDFSAVEVDFRLARTSFPDGAEKIVLRFPGDTAVSRDIPLTLPSGVTVKAAKLEVSESLRSDRAAGSGGATAGVGASAFPATRKGVRIHREMQAAQPLTPPKAATVTGLAIGLIALEAGTTARVELREDADGSPAGRILGKGTIAPAAVGRGEWSLVRFKDAVIVPSSPHWIVLTCDAGALTWLTAEAEDAVHLRRKTDGGEEWTTTSVLRDLRALQGLLTVGGAGSSAPALGLTIGGAAFPAGTPDGDRTAFDLAATLNAYLGSAPSSGGMADITIKCNALGPGSITVYPPRIEFER